MDSLNATPPDRRPSIVICAYDPDDRRWDPFEDLSGQSWAPAGVRTDALEPDVPEKLLDRLRERLRSRETRAVLLVGSTRGLEAFQVQMRAENRAPDGQRAASTGPAVARTTAPVADMVRAMGEAGLTAHATSTAAGDVGCFLFYGALSEVSDTEAPPAVALIRAPSDAPASVVNRGVKAAAEAIARQLAPLPRGMRGTAI